MKRLEIADIILIGRMRASAFLLAATLIAAAAGSAQEFGGVRYLGHFTPSGGGYTAGCWGWTDTISGREYALLGNSTGTAIVEITNVGAMVERDFIPGPNSSWREIQVHENYAYVVSEGGGGTQIINLSYLPDSAHLVQNFVYTSGGKNTQRTHSNQIRDGFLYLNGCANWSPGGVLIFNLANPEAPAFVGEWAGTYAHDSFVRLDTLFAAGIYGSGLHIIDISNKAAPVLMSTISYTGAGTHNAATSADGRYAFTTDEIGSTAKTLKVWDLRTGGFPKVAEYIGSPTATVHNVFVNGDLAIMSYYTAGMRVVDITDPENLAEIGGYDTYPANNASGYTGAWSVYPFFPSGKIIIGDMVTGMYVVDVNLEAPKNPQPFTAFSDYVTPTQAALAWDDPTELISGDPLTDFVIHVYRNGSFIAEVDSGVESHTDNGLTEHNLYQYTIRAVIAAESSVVSMATIWAGGHPDPRPPTAFQASDGVAGVTLDWINPSAQVDGTALDDLAWIIILRDGTPIDSIAQTSADTGQARTFTDTVTGYHTYTVRVRDNESPVHYSALTAGASGYGGLYLAYYEAFDSVLSTLQVTGLWDTTSAVSSSGPVSLTDSRVGSYNPSTTSTVVFPPVALGGDPILRFEHIAVVAFGDFAFVDISRDNRVSWSVLKVYNWNGHPAWQDGYADPGDWEEELLHLAAYADDTVNIRFRLITNGTTNADGWYLDNIYIGPAGEPFSGTYDVASGWNLVSLPLDLDVPVKDSVYPSSVTDAYAYDNGYVTADTLSTGLGYWLKFGSPDGVPMSGTTVMSETVDVAAGWNLVGSISETIDASSPVSIPAGIIASQFYGYDGAYVNASELIPGQAYWVKASQNGKIVLSAYLAGAAPVAVPAGHPTASAPEDEFDRLTFTDAAGHRQTLYVADIAAQAGSPAEGGPGNRNGGGSPFGSLPPLPPPGAFDIRYATGTNSEVPAAGAEVGITVQGAAWPVRVSWKSADGSRVELRAGGKVQSLGEGDELVLTEGAPIALFGFEPGTAGIPEGFALSQNYPNPFNPSTRFEISLPEPGDVTIVIYNTPGQKVATLTGGHLDAGRHTIVWDLTDDERITGGVYYASMSVTGADGAVKFRAWRKVVFLK